MKEQNGLITGNCNNCGRKTSHINPESKMCFGCELEEEERRERLDPDPYSREDVFNHDKQQNGWPDDMDEEIWDKHYRHNTEFRY